MKTLAEKVITSTIAIAIALFGLVVGTTREARAADYAHQPGPLVKNLMALTYRAPVAQAAVPAQLTEKEIKSLTAAAESSEDHLRLARYYKREAVRLDSQAAGYEAASAVYRHGPSVKNLMAHNTAARYDFFAKGFRNEAKSDRALAASHEEMARNAA